MTATSNTLDYATETNADPSAARYLRWVVAGIVCLFTASEGLGAIQQCLAFLGITSVPSHIRYSSGTSSQIMVATVLLGCGASIGGVVGVISMKRWGARLIFWSMLVVAMLAFMIASKQYYDVYRFARGRDNLFVQSHLFVIALYDLASYHIVVLLTTPPMARLMRLR